MRWLSEQFGGEQLRSAPVVLATEAFFPDPYRGTEEDAGRVFERVCGYMGVERARVRLAFFNGRAPDLGAEFRPEGSSFGAAGLYSGQEQELIRVERAYLK